MYVTVNMYMLLWLWLLLLYIYAPMALAPIILAPMACFGINLIYLHEMCLCREAYRYTKHNLTKNTYLP